MAISAGCGVDSWMLDPSVVGRWEHTPTIVPVLERIDIIESDQGEFFNVTQVRPEDLVPEPVEYRLAPGDVVEIEILDFIERGRPSLNQAMIDQRGFVALPLIDPVFIAGLTAGQAQTAIADVIKEKGILDNPALIVRVPRQGQSTYGVLGLVPNVGRFSIPYPEFRLLDALITAGGVQPTIPKVYVIRQVSLSETGTGAPLPPQNALPDQPPPDEPAPTGDELRNLIDNLLDEEPSGGALRSAPQRAVRSVTPSAISPSAMANLQDGDEPLIDLDSDFTPATDEAIAPTGNSPGRWVFLDGRWQRVTSAPTGGLGEGADPLASAGGTTPLMTQRVIEVPVRELLRGDADVNIIVRPGDVINVPSPDFGVVYVGGAGIARPGTYNLSGNTKLTVQRAVVAAGGMSAIGIPERVDLTRMIGANRQATLRLDVRAIFEGTAPDIILKPDDMLNFGTNFWATPLAVLRGGFRTSYGFGFLLDRNFGNDVFGAPPTNRQGF
ncbi:MAG: polysaccharide biosynthesis/export family protein [Phycisphaerales bacterium]|nr:polysaccharide biosynthesis/export family protein [Phycisphaerales bacterium]